MPMLKKQKLKVPFAYDGEKGLCAPQTAEKGKQYFCPACEDTVILKKGEIKTAHFAHKVSETCNQETIIHKIAKQRIVDVICEWKRGRINAPIFKRQCKICSELTDQPMPDKVERAVLEYKVTNGFIVDVALIVANEPAAAIEIRVSHAVDENKARLLPIPFIEVDGQAVIENPTIFEPVRDCFKEFTCKRCKQTIKQFGVKVNKIAKQTNVDLPDRYYRYGFWECWKCKREIILFAWPKTSDWDKSAPKVKPIPRTIQYRYSKTVAGRYWVNTCPYCKSIQGDWFLFAYPGPFFGVRCKEDSQDAYNKDMQDIVVSYAEYKSEL